MKNSWIGVARDVAIIMILTFLGGFVIGLAAAGRQLPIAIIGISNLLFGTVGFFIAGCLTQHARWRHLLIVALFVWIVSLTNLLFHVSFLQWLLAPIGILLMMGIGGGLSFLFVRQSIQVPPEI